MTGTLIDFEEHDESAEKTRFDRAVGVLTRYWGHKSFRQGQWDVVNAVLCRRDVMAILPTGTGKSVCYQIPGLMDSRPVLVVSPLIALMRDQVDGLRARGIAAVALNSSLRPSQRQALWQQARDGAYRFVYVSPELLQTSRFSDLASNIDFAFVAVDEAHCIAEWGRRFRPAYRHIVSNIDDRIPRVALTATATPSVRREVRKVLKLRSPKLIVTGYDRPNIFWSVSHVAAFTADVRRVLSRRAGATIIYCMTRRSVEWWAEWLASEHVPASYYHGGMGREERDRAQIEWLSNRSRVMVATNAFGMGIDKPDVRNVIHIGLPANLSAYYQEAGRAGRDGQPSFARLLYQNADIIVRKKLIASGFSSSRSSSLNIAARQFRDLLRYAESGTCRRRYILNYFGEAFKGPCDNCDQCRRRSAGHAPHVADWHASADSAARTTSNLVREGILKFADDLSGVEITPRGRRLLNRQSPHDALRKLTDPFLFL